VFIYLTRLVAMHVRVTLVRACLKVNGNSRKLKGNGENKRLKKWLEDNEQTQQEEGFAFERNRVCTNFV
jgi:murein endopeptidase